MISAKMIQKIRLVSLVLAAIMLFSSCSSKTGTSMKGKGVFADMPETVTAPENKGYTQSVSNQNFKMDFNPSTCEFMITDLKTSKVWYSNPPDRAQDPIATSSNKEALASQVLIRIFNQKNQTTQYNSAKDSVALGKFITKKEGNNTFSVTYNFGKIIIDYDIPKALTKERFEELLAKFENSSDPEVQKLGPKFKNKYSLATMEQLNNNPEFRDTFLEQYPIVKERATYICRPVSFKKAYDDLRAMLAAIGYTKKDLEEDNKENKLTDSSTAAERYQLTVKYKLTADGLQVTVPSESIVVPEGYYIQEISVLPYFAAEGAQSNGYFVLPDGSGSVMNMNNGRTNYSAYKAKVYGKDDAVFEMSSFKERQAYLPVYGISGASSSMFAIVEKGDEIANINAMVGGLTSQYNYAYPSFEVLDKEIFFVGSDMNAQVNFFAPYYHKTDMQINYMLFSEKLDYSQLAKKYQDYLIGKKILTKQTEKSSVNPVYLTLTGSVLDETSILGIAYDKAFPLTTYSQAQKILEEFKQQGLNNISVRYEGWKKGGVLQTKVTGYQPDSLLGGKKDLTALKKYAEENDINLFLDHDIQYAMGEDKWFDGFNLKGDSSRSIAGRTSFGILRLDPALLTPVWTRAVLKPKNYLSSMQVIKKDMDKNGYSTLSLADIGTNLNSDYYKKSYFSRSDAKAEIVKSLEVAAKNVDLMFNGANQYALPFASVVMNLPIGSTELSITNYEIPFTQMVLAGCVGYVSEPYNYSNQKIQFLKTLETGSALSGSFMYRENSDLKNVEYFDNYYTSGYTNWKKEFAEVYQTQTKVFSELGSKVIMQHKRITDKLIYVKYASGKALLINYDGEAVQYEGKTVEPLSYLVVKE